MGKSLLVFVAIAALFSAKHLVSAAEYEANWESIDSRPLPAWYDEAKFGIFLHWGVYSVPSFVSEWFWYSWLGDNSQTHKDFMAKNYPPDFTYQDFAKEFTAEFFDPVQWADLIVASGAKYVVLTTKHHEGYTLWPSKHSYSWNSYDVGPRRDLVGEVAEAVRDVGLHFGLYHSLMEWFHPLYLDDKANNWETRAFVDGKYLPEIRELVNVYQPELIWSDGEWESPSEYWRATEFLAWLYNDSPVKDVVVVNDRWGSDTSCQHGGYLTCSDKYLPGELQPRKWESAMAVDTVSWGYRRGINIGEVLSAKEIMGMLVRTVSLGGNFLLNVGPTKEGTIAPIFQERLREVGEWMGINGEAIYYSSIFTTQNDTLQPDVYYTYREDYGSVFAIVLEWPSSNIITLGSKDVTDLFPDRLPSVLLEGHEGQLEYEVFDDRVKIKLPNKAIVNSKWAWVIRITPLQ